MSNAIWLLHADRSANQVTGRRHHLHENFSLKWMLLQLMHARVRQCTYDGTMGDQDQSGQWTDASYVTYRPPRPPMAVWPRQLALHLHADSIIEGVPFPRSKQAIEFGVSILTIDSNSDFTPTFTTPSAYDRTHMLESPV